MVKNIYVDGSGWNGKRSGFCIYMEGREPIIQFTEEEYTNNDMEYSALLRSLDFANDGDIIYSDSQLVVNQILGNWKINEIKFIKLAHDIYNILIGNNIRLEWVPRAQNIAGNILEKEVKRK